MSVLTRLGLRKPDPDPLIAWMERNWRLVPAPADGPPGWTGGFGGFPLRVSSPGATDPYAIAAGRLQLVFGPAPSAPEIQFFRYDPAATAEWSRFDDPDWRHRFTEDNRPVMLGGGLALDWDIAPDHPALDRLPEFAALVAKCSAGTDTVMFGDRGLLLELAAARCTTRTLDHDAGLAADVLRLALSLAPD